MNEFDGVIIATEAYIHRNYDVAKLSVDELNEACKIIFDIFSIEENFRSMVSKRIKKRFVVSQGEGTVLQQDYNHQSWFYSLKSKKDLYYWNRYRQELQTTGFPIQVVNKMDDVSDKIVDLLGNPNSNHEYNRRGLVVGSVQSGKTANYISIINKAADAGYRVVFLLTGMLNSLRTQTQERIDLGFLGYDSSQVLNNTQPIKVGVGKSDLSRRPLSMTTLNSDFNKGFAQHQLAHLTGQKEPTIFVVKKNASVLKNIHSWLSSMLSKSDFENLPMLMIDDEADQASVNTKDNDNDPTTINKNIRQILNLFPKQNYVGFTATPFANVFIDPDTEDEMYKNDLFPKDFIYSLDSPTNYVGPSSIYSSEGVNNYMLIQIDDVNGHLKLSHKKHDVLFDIPQSLKESIYLFFLGNTIRDLRGEKSSHRSMLVNMSRFTNVQNNIANTINDYVKDMQRNVSQYPYNTFRKKSFYDELKAVYLKYYNNLEDSFGLDEVLEQLHFSIQPIIVTAVNAANKADEVLDYKSSKMNGLRVIAVGGQILSRGLTLEGLMVSYFYRNSKYYDTLMQMGRWFGYRPGYEDLCRIFMTSDAIDWYTYISEATIELKREIVKMREKRLTPSDFGLRVMNHPGVLYISAPNKLRSGVDYVKRISLSSEVIETPRLYLSKDINDKNFESLNMFVKRISDYESTPYSKSKYPFFKGVPKDKIIDFLDNYTPHPSSLHFQTSQLVEYLRSEDIDILSKFDVVIAKGNGVENNQVLRGYSIKPVQRRYRIKDERIVQISGQRNRLGDTTITQAGLTKQQIEFCKNKQRDENARNKRNPNAISARTFTKYIVDRNPLLMIYIVELKNSDDSQDGKILNNRKVLGAGIGFPNLGENADKQYIVYKLNKQAYKEICYDDDYDEEEQYV